MYLAILLFRYQSAIPQGSVKVGQPELAGKFTFFAGIAHSGGPPFCSYFAGTESCLFNESYFFLLRNGFLTPRLTR